MYLKNILQLLLYHNIFTIEKLEMQSQGRFIKYKI